jgi:hypothetical protein
MRIQVICAWCRRCMGWCEWANAGTNTLRITHSICQECADKWRSELNQTFGEKASDNNR